jgi:putative ABC transport system permease protein
MGRDLALRTLRFALRQLWQSPAFAGPVIASLALGIGANAAMFALLNALLFRSIGIAAPEQIVRIAALDETGIDRGLTPAAVDVLRADDAIGGVCSVVTPLAVVEAEGLVTPRPAHAVSGECLAALGVRPALGRLIGPRDDRAGAEPVAVLSHQMWVRDFGARPTVIGGTVTIDGRPSVVVGVAEAGFTGVLLGFQPDVVYPLARLQERAQAARPGAMLPAHVLLRLRAGDDRAQTAARLQARWRRALEASVPEGGSTTARAEHLRRRLDVTTAATGLDFSLRRRFTNPLLALVTLSAVVLGIACVNVANLVLARGRQKASETALRVALGAGRWRIVRDQLAEVAWLLAAGLAIGSVTAWLAARGIVALLASTYAGLRLDVSPDARVVLVTGAVATLVLLACSAIPLWRVSTADPRHALGAGARATPGRGWGAAAMVTSQIALAFALVAGGTVCALAIGALRQGGAGFEPDSVLSVPLMPRPAGGGVRRIDQPYYADLITRIGSLPGVSAAALASNAPLLGAAQVTTVEDGGPDGRPHAAETFAVSEGFIAVMQLSMVSGRALAAGDRGAMLSESLAFDVFGTRAAVGRRLRVGRGETARDLDVVGVVGDAVVGPTRERNLRVLYTSLWDAPPATPSLLVRTQGDASATAAAVSREVQDLGRHFPARLRSLAAERDASLLQEYLLAALAAAFALLGLVIAAVGLYGLLSTAVASRRLEIGIRVALGARRSDIVRTILGWALRLVIAGVAIGVPLVWVGGRGLHRVLPVDTAALVGPAAIAAATLVVVGLAAAWLPIRRATGVPPAECLRAQ